MVKITIIKEIEHNIDTIGKPREAWLLEERVERHLPTTPDGEKHSHMEYNLGYIRFSEKSARKLFSRLIIKRRSEGWNLDCSNASCAYLKLRLDLKFEMRYNLHEVNIVIGNDRKNKR